MGGTAAASAWEEKFLDWLHDDSNEPLDFDGEEIPDRLRELLKLYDDRTAASVPTIVPDEITVDF